MDFKGHFPFGGGRCHPLTLLDDHSRFSLCLAHYANEQRTTVQQQLVSVFEHYGLPDRMHLDGTGVMADASGYQGGALQPVPSTDAGQAGTFSPQSEGGSFAG
jgi:uncharacterized protein yagA